MVERLEARRERDFRLLDTEVRDWRRYEEDESNCGKLLNGECLRWLVYSAVSNIWFEVWHRKKECIQQ